MLKVHFVSLGCPKNRVDTEVMLGKSSSAGHVAVAEPAEADVIVVNTCGFIDAAKRESVDVILEMARNKTEGRCRRLVVTGCLAQRYAGELAEEMPEVDAFVGTGDPAGVVESIAGRGERIRVAEVPCYRERDAADRAVHLSGHTAYLKIAEGCDRRCAFCIIPQLRGPQASRRPTDLVAEARRLAAAGVRELCLVAQDLTAYGRDANGPAAARRRQRGPLAGLVRKLAAVHELRWLRLHYAYPTGVDDELLDVMAGEERVAKYLDVPLQHVDDGVLRAMRRGHGGAAARRLVERLRARVAGVAIRTTFLVGHPGESEAAFRALHDFVREAELDHVGVFAWSREEGTSAALLPGRVPPREAEARRRELMRLQRDISKRKLRALRGREIEVLVEGPAPDAELLLAGRHQGQAPEVDGRVYLTMGEDVITPPPAGSFVMARVTKTSAYDVVAEILRPA